jgi:alpha-mannosidase
VDVNHAGRGLAVLHEGLSEYEVIDDATRSIALTLLRCFGTAGAPFETYEPDPLAQCQGTQRFRYAVYPHAGDCLEANVPKAAREFTVPVRTAFCTGHTGTLPWTMAFVQPDDERFQVTCFKLAEDGKSLMLRGYNPFREDLHLGLRCGVPVLSATKVTLEEKLEAPLAVAGNNTIKLHVRAGEIFTCSIVLK